MFTAAITRPFISVVSPGEQGGASTLGISGYVLVGETGLAGVTVATSTYSDVTAADGSFYLGGLPLDYSGMLTATKEGYTMTDKEIINGNFAAEPEPTALDNGDFEDGLTGWTVDYGTATIVNTGGAIDNGKFLRFTTAGRIHQRCVPPSWAEYNAIQVFYNATGAVVITSVFVSDDEPIFIDPFSALADSVWRQKQGVNTNGNWGTAGTLYVEVTGAVDIDLVDFVFFGD